LAETQQPKVAIECNLPNESAKSIKLFFGDVFDSARQLKYQQPDSRYIGTYDRALRNTNSFVEMISQCYHRVCDSTRHEKDAMC